MFSVICSFMWQKRRLIIRRELLELKANTLDHHVQTQIPCCPKTLSSSMSAKLQKRCSWLNMHVEGTDSSQCASPLLSPLHMFHVSFHSSHAKPSDRDALVTVRYYIRCSRTLTYYIHVRMESLRLLHSSCARSGAKIIKIV